MIYFPQCFATVQINKMEDNSKKLKGQEPEQEWTDSFKQYTEKNQQVKNVAAPLR